MPESLKDRTRKGLMWSAVNNGATQVLNLVIGICLARLLMPEDYGIVGVLTIFTTLAAALQNFGFTQGLINIREPEDNDYNSVFWFNFFVGLALYILLFFSAPLIADFFHEPRLIKVSRFVFLGFVISSWSISPGSYLQKNMMNREIAQIAIAALVISGSLGIFLAWKGAAFWSLAAQQVTYISVITIGRYIYCPWRPSLKIDFTPVKKMMPLGVNILITNTINILSNHLLTFIFGRMLPMRDVGNFTQANKWKLTASDTVTMMMNQLTQTVFVQVGDDNERKRRVVRKMIRFVAFFALPMLLGLALVAHEFIVVMLGEKWSESAILLQVLCVGGAFLPFYAIYQNLAIALGKGRTYRRINIGLVVLQFAVILAFIQQGILVMVIAYSTFIIAGLSAWQFFARRFIQLRHRDVLKDILPALLTTIIVLTITYFSTKMIETLWILLICRIVMAGGLYFLAMWLQKNDILIESLDNFKRRGTQK